METAASHSKGPRVRVRVLFAHYEGLNGGGGGGGEGGSTCRLSVKILLLCRLSVKIFDLCRLSVNPS